MKRGYLNRDGSIPYCNGCRGSPPETSESYHRPDNGNFQSGWVSDVFKLRRGRVVCPSGARDAAAEPQLYSFFWKRVAAASLTPRHLAARAGSFSYGRMFPRLFMLLVLRFPLRSFLRLSSISEQAWGAEVIKLTPRNRSGRIRYKQVTTVRALHTEHMFVQHRSWCQLRDLNRILIASVNRVHVLMKWTLFSKAVLYKHCH